MADLSVLLREPSPSGVLAGVDPRFRIVAAFAVVLAVIQSSTPLALVAALGLSAVLAMAANLPLWATLRRLAVMESFLAVLVAMLPFTLPGRPLFDVAGFPASQEGLARAVTIVIKVNACVMAIAALVSTIDPVVAGHALGRLRVPDKLVLLLLFAVRYVAVFADEAERLRRAMRARAFRARNDWHTWQSTGWLIGMMLVRSFERSERIAAAMKCRGFSGKFPLLDDMRAGPGDGAFAALIGLAVLALVAVEGLA